MVFSDRTLNCVECNEAFVFSSDDQRFHLEKGYSEPKRCPNCRQARRASRNQRSGSGGYERQMHAVVCDRCGKDAEVPFQPTGERPVYCDDCYAQMRKGSGY